MARRSGPDGPDVVGIREAAARLSVSIPTLRRWDSSGKLSATRDPRTGERVYPVAALEAIASGAPVDARERADRDEILGRSSELRSLAKAIADGARLVTITGPGGIGKTALLGHALGALRGSRRVVLCDLTPATEERVLSVIAAALDVELLAAAHAMDGIARRLARMGEVVLALDNAEHVTRAVAARVRALRRRAPKALFLVTSRERLSLEGEVVIDLGPLAVPSDAVKLLARSAERAGARVELRRDGSTLARIARRLDGVPLALELAGARLATFPPERLLELLAGQLDVLEDQKRTARHSTLRRAIAWSYALLSEDERALLARLSVFRGGFDADAALALGGTIGVLEALCDKSMVRRLERARFDLYVSIRDFAGEHLVEPARAAHAAWFAGLARAALDAPPTDVAIEPLARELENLRVALDWAREHDRGIAPALAIAVDHAAGATASIDERVRIFDDVLRGQKPSRVIARAQATRARLLLERGDEGVKTLERAASAARSAGDAALEEYVLGLIAVARIQHGTRAQATAAIAAAERAASRRSDQPARALTWASIGSVQHEACALEDAERSYARALALAEATGQGVLAERVRARLGRVFCDLGRLDDAEDALRAVPRLRGDRFEAWALAHRALLRWRQDRLDDAREDYRRSVELFATRGAIPFETLHRALHAASLAALGRGVDALAEIERARIDAMNDEGLGVALDLAEAHRRMLDARRSGADAAPIVSAALARSRRLRERDKDVRALAERLEAGAVAHWPVRPTLIVARDGSWASAPGKPRAEVPPGSPLRPLLCALATKRVLSRDALVALGWPGERVLPRAAAQRVYVAMSELRALGLGDGLEHGLDGYRIAPSLPVRVEGI